MLGKGRIDVAIAIEFDGRFIAKKNKLKLIQKSTSVSLHKQKVYHYLHESKAYVIPELDKVIKEMTQSGELEVLREKMIQRILNE